MVNPGGELGGSGRVDRLEKLGLEILNCNVCFEGDHKGLVPHCWHHEDILGGYGHGRILVLIINPQRPVDREWDPPTHFTPGPAPRGAKARELVTYRAIRDGDTRRKLRFADQSLRIFAGDQAGDFAPWVRNHPGHRQWLRRVSRLLLGGDREAERALLAEHFVFLDVYKHATADAEQLKKAVRDHPRISGCPDRWLRPQLAELKPAMIILCGQPVIEKAGEFCCFRDANGRPLDPMTRMALLHGACWRGWLHGPDGPAIETWTTYAISGNTEGPFWNKATAPTGTLRAAIRAAIACREQSSLRL